MTCLYCSLADTNTVSLCSTVFVRLCLSICLSVCACVYRECRSWNKGSILRCTVDYVRSLRTHQQTLYTILKKNRQLEQNNQQLKNKLQVSIAACIPASYINTCTQVE